MEHSGQHRIIRAEDVAVMGITEILRHIPRIYASYRTLAASIHAQRPDIAVLIDFPDVNFRLAKHLHHAEVPVIWFVSPQLWAWKRRRLRWVQQRVSKMLVIFPFEEAFYRARNVDATFVGHPLAEIPRPTLSRAEYAAQHTLDPTKQWIALLPGSRTKELRANLPEMLRAAAILSLEHVPIPHTPHLRRRITVASQQAAMAASPYSFLLPVANTIEPATVQAIIDRHQPLPPICLVHDARTALHHARASVVASGTATVQAALIGNPFLVVYRVSGTTFRLAKKLVRYPNEIPAPLDQHGNLPIAMPNLIAGRRIVPELLQQNFTAQTIVTHLHPLLEDTPQRSQQLHDLALLRQQLQPATGSNAILRVRNAILESLAAIASNPL